MEAPRATHLPRVDLHRHLTGSMRLETILELAEAHDLALPRTLAALRPLAQVTKPLADLPTFLAKLAPASLALVDLDTCARVAYECVEDAAQEGINYLELRFGPGGTHSPEGVVEAVIDGVTRGQRDCGLRVNLIGGIGRARLGEAEEAMRALLACRQHIVGFDLAGDEAAYPAGLFREHFCRARDAGWHITVHAGEAAGPESIWEAFRALGAERIGHGTRAIEDEDLLGYLAEHRIGLECYLTSNVQTGAVSSYAEHPLRQFLEQGILATINTDDPVTSGVTLEHELTVAAPAAGLIESQVRLAQANAMDIAFLSEAERQLLRRGGDDRPVMQQTEDPA